MDKSSGKEFLNIHETAELLGMHPNSVYEWVREGKLRAARLGKTWRIRRSDIDVFFDESTVVIGDTDEPDAE